MLKSNALPALVVPALGSTAILWMMVLATAPVGSAIEPTSATPEVSFRDDVRPILSNHCFACHGPDETHNSGGFRLDIEGEADLDEILVRIVSEDPDAIMPPPEMHKPLKPDQVRVLQQWIEQGAPYEKHWAFVAPTQPELPELIDQSWESPIDRFVRGKIESKGLTPRPRADRRTLIRRLSLDLTGLPPTIEEVETFLNDTSETAYQDLVDRLIASPAYGEHMARYWLDLVRFADTNGMHHDHYREMTPYRDWVIRSFNENLPFDQFITDQLAGDLHPDPSIDQLTASGFNRLHLIIDRGTALPEESFMKNVVDRVSSVGTAFMGLTMQCAVCHDHKYDPITQQDFYSMYAFFNNFDGQPETGGRRGTDFKRGLQEPYIEMPSPEQKQMLSRLNSEIAALQTEINAIEADKKALAESKKKAEEAKKQTNAEAVDAEKETEAKKVVVSEPVFEPTQNLDPKHLKSLQKSLAEATKKRDDVLVDVPATLVMKERKEIRPAHILIRGAYDAPGEIVPRATPAFLPPIESDSELKTRMDLAKWFVDPQNPLTARVAVNRFWQQLFGVGLVKTSEDFGAQGQTPSHPELLDHLAIEFIESGWDVQALMRSIVRSRTYQQTSVAPTDAYVADPGNRMLARGSRYRLDAEVIRDQVLATCGLLSPTMYGRSVKPPQPEGLWEIVNMPSSYPRNYVADTGENAVRRSVYTFWKRGMPPPQMTIFDAPNRDSCIARRERTNTPLQALMMMNEPRFFSAAAVLANETRNLDARDEQQRLATVYERITSHEAEPAVIESLSNALTQFRSHYEADASAATALIKNCTDAKVAALAETDQKTDLAAWTMLVHSLLNLDSVRTRE